MAEEKQPQKVNVIAPGTSLEGKYSNHAVVSHNKEAFNLDFFYILTNNIMPLPGTLINRIVLSPSQVKRISQILQKQIELYEQTFLQGNEIEISPEPPVEIGFAPQKQ
ncbi:MAG: DUF3467 domain-containing protein [Candidatus Staskawiczbacteria bacterium]|nr:DUF3467 domain-containing protein [Candidatus Staskawiczbacteria bacterium]